MVSSAWWRSCCSTSKFGSERWLPAPRVRRKWRTIRGANAMGLIEKFHWLPGKIPHRPLQGDASASPVAWSPGATTTAVARSHCAVKQNLFFFLIQFYMIHGYSTIWLGFHRSFLYRSCYYLRLQEGTHRWKKETIIWSTCLEMY